MLKILESHICIIHLGGMNREGKRTFYFTIHRTLLEGPQVRLDQLGHPDYVSPQFLDEDGFCTVLTDAPMITHLAAADPEEKHFLESF